RWARFGGLFGRCVVLRGLLVTVLGGPIPLFGLPSTPIHFLRTLLSDVIARESCTSKRGQVLFSIIFVRTILSFCQELFCHVTFCAPRTLCSHPKTHAPNQNTHASTTANTREIIRRCPDRKSTRLNSSHVSISYAVFC